jgi:type IV pilus assembly protein PilA
MKIKNVGVKMQKGFTLIELMITVAIVGILAAVALPAYQDYTIRAQFTEGMSLADGAKSNVVEYHANKGVLPANNTEASYTGGKGKFVKEVAVGANGIIVATFGPGANSKILNKKVTLKPTEDTTTGNLVWSCFSDADAKYVPTSCKDPATGTPAA